MTLTHKIGLRVASLFPLFTLVACSSSTTSEGLGGTDGSTGNVTSSTPTTGGGTTGGATTGGATTGGPTTGGLSSTTGSATTGPLGGTSTTTSAGPTTTGGGGASTTGSTTEGSTTTTGAGGATTGTTGGPTGGSGDWGLEENPSAGCTVPAMPSFDELNGSPKLPDPFTKMDGTRITDKSEWLCRREEILQQTYEYIFGDKPVPPEGSVTGTVSTSSITVNVDDGTGSTSFMVGVNMNGATAPAPAIITYSSGAPVPNGVATISFSPIEQQGGSGNKSGPFYTMYGANHPAGYLAAQAWQVSRILDVLEQDPSVIDPTRIGVTGCSRYGKGAFIAGVLDNRIALTIPVESGLGGTVGLRLVEVLDSYSGSEWPYHGISYVRWMSEVALGPFTSGNSAGADNTDRLPIDMHELMALIVPRGLYIVDNPSTMYNGLDRNAAWVTGNVGKMIYEALGVGDNMAYEGASGGHCSWRQQYQPSLDAMIDKFLKGNASASTGNVATDLPNPPNPADHIDWDPAPLAGEL